MQDALVLDRKDLCDNIQDLPFTMIELKHFKADVFDKFSTTDVVIFFDDNFMKVLKIRIGDCNTENIVIWQTQKTIQTTRHPPFTPLP